MLTPEQMDFLVALLEAVGRQSQRLLQVFLILTYNNEEFGPWVYDIFHHCNTELAADFIMQVINAYRPPFYHPNPR